MPCLRRIFCLVLGLGLAAGAGATTAQAQFDANPLRNRAPLAPPAPTAAQAPPAPAAAEIAASYEQAEAAPPASQHTQAPAALSHPEAGATRARAPREIGAALARSARPLRSTRTASPSGQASFGRMTGQPLPRGPVAPAQYLAGPPGSVFRRWQGPAVQEMSPQRQGGVPPGRPVEELPPPAAMGAAPQLAHPEGEYSGEMVGPGHEVYYDDGYAACGPGGCHPHPHGGPWGRGCVELCFPFPCVFPENLQLLAGAQGFTGPLNRGGESSFGFHEGLNLALPVWCGVCLQAGVTFTQSNFDGSLLTDDSRAQTFATLGLFRRVDWGLQGGLAIDYLHDHWDYEVSLSQLRGELSWQFPCNHEFGFWFTNGFESDRVPLRQGFRDPNQVVFRTAAADVAVNDLYAFFYRRQFCCGGEGRLFGGFTGNSQGLFGGDVWLPINGAWAFQANLLYVAPRDEVPVNQVVPGDLEESWNVSFNLVWTPFARGGCGGNYCRPLFGVANNGTFATRID